MLPLPLLTTPSLLTVNEQRRLRSSWQRALLRTRATARENVRAAIKVGDVPRGSQPHEVHLVYAFFQAGVPVFRAELERMDREGDYVEPKRVVRQGAFAWVNEFGAPQYR
jgi:hypothetical protein